MCCTLLWPPCVADADIIFLPCGFFFYLSLWSPYGIGQTIIFSSCFFFLLFLFCRLISAVGYWMSTILPNVVWPQSEFRMQVWNVLHAARCKCRTQKVAKNRHLGTIPQLCRAVCSQLRHVSTIGKNLLSSNMSSTRARNMVNFGPLAAEIISLVSFFFFFSFLA